MRKTIRKITVVVMLFAVASAFGSRANASDEASQVRVMSYNIHRGGTVYLKQPLSQTAKVIQAAKVDVVGIQETRSP